MTYSLMENVYTSNNSITEQNKENDTGDLKLECDYKIYSPISKFKAVQYTTQYINIQFYLTKIFGMDQENVIYLINNYTNSSNNSNINKIIINRTETFPETFTTF